MGAHAHAHAAIAYSRKALVSPLIAISTAVGAMDHELDSRSTPPPQLEKHNLGGVLPQSKVMSLLALKKKPGSDSSADKLANSK